MIQLDAALGWLNPSVISFNAMSVGTCKLEVILTHNRQALDLTNYRVMIEVKTPSGAIIEDNVTIVNALTGQIEKILTTGMITEKGMHYVELSIYSQDNTRLLVTNKVRYSIGVNFGEEGAKATPQYSTLQSLILDVNAIKQEGIIDLARVQTLENEANRINEESKATNLDVTNKHNDVVVKHGEVIQAGLQVSADAKRTEDNAVQVSVDKDIVTRFKNEVATNTQTVASDKLIVEWYKADTLAYKDSAELAKTQAEQLKADVQGLATTTINNITSTGTAQTNRVTTEGTKQVNLAKAQADIATLKAQEISASATQINKNKRQIVDALPTDRLNGQLFFIRKG